MLLEICANSYQSAKNAETAGAHRIELCQELSIGGITPSYGLVKQVIHNLDIPVFVLIRPRGGNFVYSDAEFQIMKHNIQSCKDLGCHVPIAIGIVSGVLNTNKTIDIKRTRELVELSKPLPFTFHRAFDELINPKEALEQLIDLGVERVLTSGQKTSAEKGISLLKELHEISNGRLIILAGGGINSENAKQFKEVGLEEIHASASKVITTNTLGYFDTIAQTVSDLETIKEILNVI